MSVNKKAVAGICGAIVVVVAVVVSIVVVNNNTKNNTTSNETNNSSAENKTAADPTNNGSTTNTNTSSSTESNSNSIVGKWSYSDPDFASAGIAFVYTFNEDGTGNYDAAGTVMDFTYSIDGNKITINYAGSGTFETEFEINGSTLNVKDSGGADTLYNRI